MSIPRYRLHISGIFKYHIACTVFFLNLFPPFLPEFIRVQYNLHDFILTGGAGLLPPLARTAIISRCYGSVIYCVKNILTLLFLMTFADSRLFTLDRLSTFYSRSTLDFLLSTFYSRLSTFYSRLSTFTLDSRLLLSTYTLDSRLLDTLKNYLPTINQVRSEIRYTTYNPLVRYVVHPCFVLKIEGCCIFSNHVALILNVSLRRLF